MSLIGALNVGKQALAVQQAAIQTTGNNIANAGNADYTRQTADLSANKGQQLKPGTYVGTGTNLDTISRQIDEALQTRLNSAQSEADGAGVTSDWLSRVEATFNELSDSDLSTQMSTFFNGWSDLANKPQDAGLRQVVLQDGQGVATLFQNLRSQLDGLQKDSNDRLGALVGNADQLAQQAADLNRQIATAEGGAVGSANGLRDQRDAVLKQLSSLVDVKTTRDGSNMNVFVGSEPLVMGDVNRGLAMRQDQVEGKLVSTVIFKQNNGAVNVASGQIGALQKVQTKIDGVADNIDTLAGNFIFELNKIHSSGQGLDGISSVTGSNSVKDVTAALNNDASGLKFKANNGSFVVHVKNRTTGLTTSTLVKVDLDGLNGDDTTLNSLSTSIDNIDGITASVNAGKLVVNTDSSDTEVSFSQDSSGALASLGVGTFFTGSKASDIAVNSTIANNTNLIAAAKNGDAGDNQTALSIASLETTTIKTLNGGQSLKDNYEGIVNDIAASNATAKNNAEAATVVQQTLQAQRESLSGVSLDEEAVNLMKQQRAYQGAARFLSTVNELMDTVLNLVK